MSSTTNTAINSRSMNGVITISDGQATLENGDLNCDDIISSSLNTSNINTSLLTCSGKFESNLNGPYTIPISISNLTGLLISYGNVTNSGATDFTNFQSTYTSTQGGFRFYNKSATQTLTNLAIIDNSQTYFSSKLTNCTAESPLNGNSIANKTYIDSNFVDRTNNLTQNVNGEKTFTSNTTFNAQTTFNNLTPICSVASPTAVNHLTRKDYVDNNFLDRTNNLTQNVNGLKTFSVFPQTTAITPTLANELIRKDYVDNNFVDRTNNLTQNINGPKTFTDDITAPNIYCNTALYFRDINLSLNKALIFHQGDIVYFDTLTIFDNYWKFKCFNIEQVVISQLSSTFNNKLISLAQARFDNYTPSCTVSAPTQINHLTRKDYVDNNFLDRTNNLTQNINGLKTFANNTNFTGSLLSRTNIKLSEYENTASTNTITLAFPMSETIALRTTPLTSNPMTINLPLLTNNERGYVFTFNKLFDTANATNRNFPVTFNTSGGQGIYTLYDQAGTPTSNTTLLSLEKIQCKLAVGWYDNLLYWIEQTDFSTYDRYKLTEWGNATTTNTLTLTLPLPPTIALRTSTQSTMTITLPTLTTLERGKIFTFVKVNSYNYDVIFNTSSGQAIYPVNNLSGAPTSNTTIFPSNKKITRLAVGWFGGSTYWIEVSDYSTFDIDQNNLLYARLASPNAFTNTNTFNSFLPTSTLTPSLGTHLITKTFSDQTYINFTTDQTLASTGVKRFPNIFTTGLNVTETLGGGGNRFYINVSNTSIQFVQVNYSMIYKFFVNDSVGNQIISLQTDYDSTVINNNLVSNAITYVKEIRWRDQVAGTEQQSYLSGTIFDFVALFNSNTYRFFCRDSGSAQTTPLTINSANTTIANNLISSGQASFNGDVYSNTTIFVKDLSWKDVQSPFTNRIQSYLNSDALIFFPQFNLNRYAFITKDVVGNQINAILITNASTTIGNNLVSNNLTSPTTTSTNNIYTSLVSGGAINIGASLGTNNIYGSTTFNSSANFNVGVSFLGISTFNNGGTFTEIEQTSGSNLVIRNTTNSKKIILSTTSASTGQVDSLVINTTSCDILSPTLNLNSSSTINILTPNNLTGVINFLTSLTTATINFCSTTYTSVFNLNARLAHKQVQYMNEVKTISGTSIALVFPLEQTWMFSATGATQITVTLPELTASYQAGFNFIIFKTASNTNSVLFTRSGTNTIRGLNSITDVTSVTRLSGTNSVGVGFYTAEVSAGNFAWISY